MELLTCPRCGMRVVFTSQGTCPACRQDVAIEGAPKEEPFTIAQKPIRAEATREPKIGAHRKRAFPFTSIGLIVMLLGYVYFLLRAHLGSIPENPTTPAERGAAAAPFLDFLLCESAGIAIVFAGVIKGRREKGNPCDRTR
jgi:hypothetical protein